MLPKKGSSLNVAVSLINHTVCNYFFNSWWPHTENDVATTY